VPGEAKGRFFLITWAKRLSLIISSLSPGLGRPLKLAFIISHIHPSFSLSSLLSPGEAKKLEFIIPLAHPFPVGFGLVSPCPDEAKGYSEGFKTPILTAKKAVGGTG